MPIDAVEFSKGLMRLATAYRQPLDDQTFEFYHEALVSEADPETWEAFTKRAAAEGLFRDAHGILRFPHLPDLIEAYRHERAVLSGRVLNPPPTRILTDEELEERHQEQMARFRQGVPAMKARLREHGVDVDELLR